jgi:hypothetical protein
MAKKNRKFKMFQFEITGLKKGCLMLKEKPHDEPLRFENLKKLIPAQRRTFCPEIMTPPRKRMPPTL